MSSDRHFGTWGHEFSRRRFMQSAAAAAGVVTFGGMMTSRASAANALVWYSGSSVESVDDWTKAYKEKSGTTVEYFRAGGVKLAQKFEQEAKAGQVKCDTIDISLPGLMTQWANNGLLMKYESPEASHYPADLRMAGFWTPIKALDICIAYNADIIKPEDAPKSWADLVDPKWKGKMVMADPALSGGVLQWYSALRKLFGNDYVEKLGKQDILIRSGSGEVLDTIITGERPLAASALQYYASAKAKSGVNIRMVFPPEGVPVGMEIIGISAAAPDPEGAKKFIDYSLGKEAQELWQSKYFAPSLRDDVAPLPEEFGRVPLNKVKLISSTVADAIEIQNNQGPLLEEFSAFFK